MSLRSMIEHTGRSIESVARETFPFASAYRHSSYVDSTKRAFSRSDRSGSRVVRRYDSLLANDSLNTIKLVMTVALISVVAANVCQPRCEK